MTTAGSVKIGLRGASSVKFFNGYVHLFDPIDLFFEELEGETTSFRLDQMDAKYTVKTLEFKSGQDFCLERRGIILDGESQYMSFIFLLE